MDNVTITILVLLSFLLVWVGVMIFTTKPEDEVVEEEKNVQAQPMQEVMEMPEQSNRSDIATYKRIIAELEGRIRTMEEQPKPTTNDTLMSWLSELRRDNEMLKMKISHLEGGRSFYESDALRYENEKLRRELDDHRVRVETLEHEVKDLKNSINYYRDIVSKLQGSYHVLNKHNYRTCIRDPETGEYEYQLIKLPQDFDPFNPTYITRDGTEVHEDFGIQIPTKLGDIIREEFKKDVYWQDFELDR
jgi:regulator of replication initiation timing